MSQITCKQERRKIAYFQSKQTAGRNFVIQAQVQQAANPRLHVQSTRLQLCLIRPQVLHVTWCDSDARGHTWQRKTYQFVTTKYDSMMILPNKVKSISRKKNFKEYFFMDVTHWKLNVVKTYQLLQAGILWRCKSSSVAVYNQENTSYITAT